MPTDKPVLPDFTRWQWGSAVERNWWKPLFTEASNAFLTLERESVAAGLRDATWQFVQPDQIVPVTEWAHRNGLIMIPTGHVHSSGVYSASGSGGNPNAFRVVITRPELYKQLLPWKDDGKIGQWLGYPECCRQAFAQTWSKGQVDSIYEQYSPTRHFSHSLLRFMGVRLVSHMPCRNDCEPSKEIAQQMFELGRTLRLTEEMSLLREMLLWPVTATRLHGINEMTFPAIKIVARTDWTPTLEQFEYTDGVYFKPTADLWTDNGFNSHEGMRASHRLLLDSLIDRCPANARVLDLGCGNGMLLRRLQIYRPDIQIAGIDKNTDAIKRTSMMRGKWIAGDISQIGKWLDGFAPTVVLINPARLLEMDHEHAGMTRLGLSQVPHIFVYAYSDWTKTKTLDELTHEAGLTFERSFESLQTTPIGSVGLVA